MKDMPGPEEIAALLAELAERPLNEDAPEQLPAMMRTLGLNPSAVQLICTDEYGALELSCAKCGNATTCRLWLDAADRDDPAYRTFCLNARRLEKLRDFL